MKIKYIYFLGLAFLVGCQMSTPPPGYESVPAGEGYAITPEYALPNGIKFSLKSDGIEASYSFTSKVTFLGTFGLKVSKKLFQKASRPFFAETGHLEKSSLYDKYKFDRISVIDRKDIHELMIKSSDLIVAIIRDTANVDVFVISEGLELYLIPEGYSPIRIRKDYVEIDVRHSKIWELNLYRDSTYNPTNDFFEERVMIERAIQEDIFNDQSAIVDLPTPKAGRRLNYLDSLRADSMLNHQKNVVNKQDSVKKKKIFIPY